jgi:cold shock CspA family protein
MSVIVKSGVVKMVGPNFAFATADDGSGDCFIPRSTIEESGIALEKGDAITYSATLAPRGPRATSIKLAS